jgi:carbamate kinase
MGSTILKECGLSNRSEQETKELEAYLTSKLFAPPPDTQTPKHSQATLTTNSDINYHQPTLSNPNKSITKLSKEKTNFTSLKQKFNAHRKVISSPERPKNQNSSKNNFIGRKEHIGVSDGDNLDGVS